MFSRLDEFIKQFLLVCLGITILSFMLLYSYMDKYDLTFNDIFSPSIGFVDSEYRSFPFKGLDINFDSNLYETIEMKDERTFDLVDRISVNSTIEEIQFIHENRQDIKVLYTRELPDTPAYRVDYSADIKRNELLIDVKLNKTFINLPKNYSGSILIYLPMDYKCNQLNITSTFGDQTLSLPKVVNDVDIAIDFGNLLLTNDASGVNNLRLTSSFGDIHFISNTPVNYAYVSMDSGSIDLDIKGPMNKLEVLNNMGDIDARLSVAPNNLMVSNDMGDINIVYLEPAKALTVEMDMGDVDIDLLDDDTSVVYINSGLGDATNNFLESSNKNKANIKVNVDLGDLDIY